MCFCFFLQFTQNFPVSVLLSCFLKNHFSLFKILEKVWPWSWLVGEESIVATLSSSNGCCKWRSDHTSSHTSCGAAGFQGFSSNKQLLVSVKQWVWIHNLDMLHYIYWCSRDSYSQMEELSFFRLAWKVKSEEAVGIETGKGEFGVHLQKSILMHKKVGEDNQIKHFKNRNNKKVMVRKEIILWVLWIPTCKHLLDLCPSRLK